MQHLINYLLATLLLIYPQQNSTGKTVVYLTGDIMLGRSVSAVSYLKNNPAYPFALVSDRLKSADIVFSNLESPIINDCPSVNPELKFCAKPDMLDGLKSSGIDIVSLANNHIFNFGKQGLLETRDLLTRNGIKWVGMGNLEIIEKNGVKYGFLGFNYVDYKLANADLELIKKSKTKADILIIGVHWGVEYTNSPTSMQKEIAGKLIESGADVIAGHHPHTIQALEMVNGKPVFYSLGNFVFDQMWSEQTRQGVVGQLDYIGKDLLNSSSLPAYIDKFAQPSWLN